MERVKGTKGNLVIGTRVMIRKGTFYYLNGDVDGNDPCDTTGVITKVTDRNLFPYFVKWDNGKANVYSCTDLGIANTDYYKHKFV